MKDKKIKVSNYHRNTIERVQNMAAAAGFNNLKEIKRAHIYGRISVEKIVTLEELYPEIRPGELLQEPYPGQYTKLMRMADVSTFLAV